MTIWIQCTYEFIIRKRAHHIYSSFRNAPHIRKMQVSTPSEIRTSSKKLKGILPKEFENLRNSGTCFICHHPGYMMHKCSYKVHKKEEGTWRPVVKKEVLDREMLVANEEMEAESTAYHSILFIKIPVKIKGISMTILIDCRAEGNFISERVIKEKKLSTLSTSQFK